jgi:hypothetical protein
VLRRSRQRRILGARAGRDAAWQAIMTHGGLAMPGLSRL